jgi:hypothetical protein
MNGKELQTAMKILLTLLVLAILLVLVVFSLAG